MQKLDLTDAVYEMHATDCDFACSQLEDVRLSGSKLMEVSFSDSQFSQVLFDQSQFDNTSWVDVSIKNSRYDGMTIEGIPVLELLALYRQKADGVES